MINTEQLNAATKPNLFNHIDIALVYSSGDPIALVVLVEEELVVVDLQTDGWPVFQTPYLVPLHCSAITCSHHVSSIPLKLWERVHAAGKLQNTSCSKKVFGIHTLVHSLYNKLHAIHKVELRGCVYL